MVELKLPQENHYYQKFLTLIDKLLDDVKNRETNIPEWQQAYDVIDRLDLIEMVEYIRLGKYQETTEKATMALIDHVANMYAYVVINCLNYCVAAKDKTMPVVIDGDINLPGFDTLRDMVEQSEDLLSCVAVEARIQKVLTLLQGEEPLYRISRLYLERQGVSLKPLFDGTHVLYCNTAFPFIKIGFKYYEGEDLPIPIALPLPLNPHRQT